MCSVAIYSAEPSLEKLDGPVFKTRGSTISRTLDKLSKMMMADLDDWRTPLVHYLENPGHIVDRKVWLQALKYVMHNNTLYSRIIDSVLLKYLGSDQFKIAMGGVHEGICGTHQSAHKMKWLLCRAGFYWPTMINNCFRYYKGCKSCQKFGDVQLATVAILHPIMKSWPFRGWALNFIGQIHPSSSRGHRFVLVAIDTSQSGQKVIQEYDA
jgi:hypothetical protein